MLPTYLLAAVLAFAGVGVAQQQVPRCVVPSATTGSICGQRGKLNTAKTKRFGKSFKTSSVLECSQHCFAPTVVPGAQNCVSFSYLTQKKKPGLCQLYFGTLSGQGFVANSSATVNRRFWEQSCYAVSDFPSYSGQTGGILEDGSFEQSGGSSAWTINAAQSANSNVDLHALNSGDHSASIYGVGTDPSFDQAIPACAGTVYELTFNAGGMDDDLDILANGVSLGTVSNGGGTLQSFYFTTTKSAIDVAFEGVSSGPAFTDLIDNANIIAVYRSSVPAAAPITAV